MAPSTSLPIRLLTFNIRYAATHPFKNEAPWATRAPLVVKLIKETASNAPPGNIGAETVSVIGLQEVLHAQLLDLQAGLGPDWAHLGVGRDDGKQAGEYNPIMYRPSVLRLLDSETKWLSPSPEEPSYGWGAGSRRLVNVAVFEHVATGRRFVAANTHLDDASSTARSKGVKVALGVIKGVRDRWGELGVLLTGDFNSKPGEDAYKTVMEGGYLSDLYTLAEEERRVGPHDTFTGFLPDEEEKKGKRIDYIWLGPSTEDRWMVDRYEVLSNVVDGVYMSDHRAVLGDLELAT